ncbi:MAG: Glycosyl transferase, group 1 family [Parcubacteria group bacterium GW2011_GWA2_47_7]|nr:MAG: Glycosyl transferase, group 1 family [Parcubacteria group bacterium GW2011_GWA2_47_7]
MFGWEFPPHNSGGLGTACYGLTKSLTKSNVSVTFVLPKKLGGLNHDFLKIVFANIRNIKIRGVTSLIHPYITSELYDEYLLKAPEHQLYGLNLFDEVRRYGLQARLIAAEEPHDVIHAHDWLSFRAGIEAKRISGKPLIVHVHATEFDRTGGKPNQFIYDEERRGLHAADCIIAVSQLTKNVIVEHYGIEPSRVMVVHNGIDHKDFRHALPPALKNVRESGKKVVLFVGRITIQKGPDYFIKVAKRVLELDPSVLFVVSGSGDMEHQIIRLASDMGLGDKIIFAGFVRGDELLKLYRAADLFVMPSVSEPFGLTALEALANGTPILVSKQSGVSEVVTHALKSDFWDIDDMADKILNVVSSRGLHDTLGELGSTDVEHVTWESAAGKCTQIYRDIINSAK